jgi:hypothetical protein
MKNIIVIMRAQLMAGLCFGAVAPALWAAPLDPNSFTSLGTLNVTAGTLNINTDTLQISGAASFSGIQQSQVGGTNIAVFTFADINLGSGVVVNLTGDRPLALLSHGNMTLGTLLDLSPVNQNTMAAATYPRGRIGGANGSHTTGGGPGGGGAGSIPSGSGGGGGGGFGGSGGNGGAAGQFNSGSGSGGIAYGNLFQTLEGGSGGGSNGGFGVSGGGGGGGIELGAAGTIHIQAGGQLKSNGGNSGATQTSNAGGQAGGSGGGILLHASAIVNDGQITADGGFGVNQSSAFAGGGGGGGRVAIEGVSTYSLGAAVGGITVNGGAPGAPGTATFTAKPGSAGVVTVSPQTAIVPSGKSVLLDGTPVISRTSISAANPTVEVLIRRSLTVEGGGNAMLGADDVLDRDATMTIDGTFNVSRHEQTVGSLISATETGLVELNDGGQLHIARMGSFSYGGEISGLGTLWVGEDHLLTLSKNNGFNDFNGNLIIDGALALAGTTENNVFAALAGTGTLTAANGTSYLDETTNFRGTLVAQGGTLQLGGNAPEAHLEVESAATLHQTSSTRLHSVQNQGTVQVDQDAMLTLGGANSTSDSTGEITGAGGLRIVDGAVLAMSGTAGYTGVTDVRDGVLEVRTDLPLGDAVKVGANGTLLSGANIHRPVRGEQGSTIQFISDNVTLGQPSAWLGFQTAGTLIVNSNNVTLASGGFARLDGLTAMTGGVINSPSGVSLGSGAALSGHGQVNGKFAGGVGSIIEAEGPLTLGEQNSLVGFVTAGEIHAKQHSIVLKSKNAATLGSLTTLGSAAGGGTVNADNGLVLNFGGAVTGHGALDTPNLSTKAFINNGDIAGDSMAEPITLSGYLKGVGTLDNVVITGTAAPGFSPAAVSLGNVAYAGALEIELGGTQPGSGYDQLNHAIGGGLATLGGALDVSLWGGFTPAVGDVFEFITATGGVSGAFARVDLPALGTGLDWELDYEVNAVKLRVVALPTYEADFDEDGDVDGDDLLRWRVGFGDAMVHGNGDADADGDVDGSDFLTWQQQLGSGVATTGGTLAVPEPAAWGMVVATMLVLVKRRKRIAPGR